ncbi:MAG TPA: hypothetical protein VFA12_01420 [Stellaceae bacterium]|nr:hypothetical protein [Stellaceae bacterium]
MTFDLARLVLESAADRLEFVGKTPACGPARQPEAALGIDAQLPGVRGPLMIESSVEVARELYCC